MPQSQIKPCSLVDTDTWCEPVVETSSQNADSISTCYQPTERPKELSFACSSGQGQLQAIEEFLEINDINNSESINRAADCTGNQNPGHNINGLLYDPDEYFDASMFLAEAMAPLDGTTSGGTYSYFVGFEDETQFHYPHITSDLWTHDQNFTVPTSVEPHQVAMESPSSGA